MAHTYSSLLYHVTFSTKNRKNLIDAGLEPELLAYLAGIVRKLEGKAITVNATTDHVHILMQLPPAIAVADAQRIIKTSSSRWVHRKWPLRKTFRWQTGYGAFTVSASRRSAVIKYITNQEEHHRRVTFREEFLGFFKKHKIEYDERYIWD